MTNKQILDTGAKLMPAEAASMLYVSTRTLTRMASRGEVSVIELPSGHRRYLRVEIEALAKPRPQSTPVESTPPSGSAGVSSFNAA